MTETEEEIRDKAEKIVYTSLKAGYPFITTEELIKVVIKILQEIEKCK